MKSFSFKGLWDLIKSSFKGFSEDKVPKLGGSLAYFTFFSIGPLLLVVIFLAGLIMGRQAIEGNLAIQAKEIIGEESAQLLQRIVSSAATNKQSILTAIVGIITLLLGATSVFVEIQDSINRIWKLKVKPRLGWKFKLRNRLIAFGIIAGMSFLLLVTMSASAIIEGLGQNIGKIFPVFSLTLIYIISHVFTLFISTILFASVFRMLPAGQLKWRNIWPGAILTAILFMIGRIAISYYISRSDFGSTYGAAGSLVVLMVWVYYSALILYFGAEFTKFYLQRLGIDIPPRDYAVSTA